MRKWHRWLSVFFGVFLLWIASTGLLSHGAAIVAHGGFESHERHAAEEARAEPAFVCPPDYSCRRKPEPGSAAAWVGKFHHLHSGEDFGPLGTVISIMSGLALLFFAFSGLWMYIQMWRHRRDRDLKPGWFWK